MGREREREKERDGERERDRESGCSHLSFKSVCWFGPRTQRRGIFVGD
jgi:hypothetical protein